MGKKHVKLNFLPYFMTCELRVVISAHYLKNEYLYLPNFSFEILHPYLRWYGETSADLAANFKLTNQSSSYISMSRKQTPTIVKAAEE